MVKTFKQFIVEVGGKGDCLELASGTVGLFGTRFSEDGDLTDILKKAGATQNNIRCVHAFVTGQGAIAGYRFVHAWIEVGTTVFDFSNGNSVIMAKSRYYEQGQVNPDDPGQYRVYNYMQTQKKLSQTHHYGPWDLDDFGFKPASGMKNELFESAALNEELKIFPRTLRAIGKHKIKLSKAHKTEL